MLDGRERDCLFNPLEAAGDQSAPFLRGIGFGAGDHAFLPTILARKSDRMLAEGIFRRV